jgi:MoxR-like ATPase
MKTDSISAGTRSESPAVLLDRLRANVSGVLLGKPEVVRLALVALLAEGHLLLEDVPGIGKTLLARAVARSLDCKFHRIQFTPDLLPSDLLGTSVYHSGSGEFIFKPGPLFAQVILADEINRATPRTQSALLEAMSERQVSIDGQTHRLGPIFLVLATQNPYEFEGTYPLPESQLDRFLLRLRVGYPERGVEKEILRGHRQGEPIDALPPVLAANDILTLQESTREVVVADPLSEYILDLLSATRRHPGLALGASIRAGLSLYRAAQAFALLDRRNYVIPDDVKRLANPVLAHRLLPKSFRQGATTEAAEKVIDEIVQNTPVPT